MSSPMEQIRWGLRYIRARYGGRQPRFYLYVDGGELQQITSQAVAALIEEHTQRLRAEINRDGRR